jgi:hypothetical protein
MKKQLNIWFDPSTYNILHSKAAEEGSSLSKLVGRLTLAGLASEAPEAREEALRRDLGEIKLSLMRMAYRLHNEQGPMELEPIKLHGGKPWMS